MKKQLKYIIPILLVLLVFLAIKGYKIIAGKSKTVEKEIALPVYRVDTGTVVLDNSFLGSVEGKYDVEIRPQVEGELQEAYVDEGDYTEKGQELFRIDSRKYEEALNRVIANENVERAKLENARTEIERLEPLVENNVMAPVRLEKEKANYRVAKANLERATAEVANAKIELEYTIIKAPVNGYIGRIRKRIGNLVNPNDKEPITVLTDVKEVYVYFSISESDFMALNRIDSSDTANEAGVQNTFNQTVSLILPDGTPYKEKGIIEASAGQVNKNTGTVTIRARFPNSKSILRAGGTVTLVREDVRRGVILIPKKATYELQAKTFVQKLTPDNRTVRQLIEISAEAPNNQFIVKSGLNPGDKILVEGQNRVSDSSRIMPLPYNPDTLIAPGVKSNTAPAP